MPRTPTQTPSRWLKLAAPAPAPPPAVAPDRRLRAALSGWRVLITGPAAGVGRALAHVYAAHGAHVALADIADTSAVEAECRALGAAGVVSAPFDAGKDGDGARMVAAVAAAWGGEIDGVVLNHTIGVFGSVLDERDPAAVAARNMRINYLAYVEVQAAAMGPLLAAARARAAAAATAAAPGGACRGGRARPSSIVAISSLAALLPMLNTHAYSASKAAITNWFDCLRLEIDARPDVTGLLTVGLVFFSAIKTETLLRALGPLDGPNKRALSFAASPVDAAWAVVRAGVSGAARTFFPANVGAMPTLYALWPALARRIINSVVVKQVGGGGK